MQHPYFSVVIPTKNRSWILKYAIQSLVLQSFTDFEVVIADNDDGPATRQAVDEFKDDRIKYFKSGNLSMADNWEFAISKACGEYVLIMEDKEALKLTALEILFTLTQNHKHGCIKWIGEGFSDTHGKHNRIRIPNVSGKIYKVPSDVILNTFLRKRPEAWHRTFPVGPFSAIHRDIIDRVKNGPLKRLCIPVNPDHSMAYAMLYYNDYILCIDRGLTIGTTNKIGNGKDFRVKGPVYKNFIKESASQIDYLYDGVPIKAITIYNSIYNDFMRIRRILGGRLLQHDLDLPNYFTRIYMDIQHAMEKNADMSQEDTAWKQAYSQQPQQVRNAIDAMIKSRIDDSNTVTKRLVRQINKIKKVLTSNKTLLKQCASYNEMSEGWVNIKMHFDNPINYLIWDKENPMFEKVNCEEIIVQNI